jgi:hypothetical protein
MEKRQALLAQNKPLDFIKDEEFLEHLSGSQLLNLHLLGLHGFI